MLPVDSDVVAKTVGEKLIAKIRKLGHVFRVIEIRGPAQLVARGRGVRKRRGGHHFEILLVLRSGAGGDFVEPLAVLVFQAAEAVEGVEKLVVRAVSGIGHEAAHREAVDEFVVESLVFDGVGGKKLAVGALAGFCGLRKARAALSTQRPCVVASRRKVSA